MPTADQSGAHHVPARDLPIPAYLSAVAQAYLTPLEAWGDYPAIEDKAAWRAYVAAVDGSVLSRFPKWSEASDTAVAERNAGAPVSSKLHHPDWARPIAA